MTTLTLLKPREAPVKARKEKSNPALICRLKIKGWEARDGWPRTNAFMYGERDELQRGN